MMNFTFAKWLGLRKKLTCFALLFAFLASVLSAVLPAPALSAEQQLLNDLATNICSINNPIGKPPATPMDHGPHCILCGPINNTLPLSGNLELGVALPLIVSQLYVTRLSNQMVPHRPDWRSTAPRGPPNFCAT